MEKPNGHLVVLTEALTDYVLSAALAKTFPGDSRLGVLARLRFFRLRYILAHQAPTTRKPT